jgi:hypothetical protein
LSCVGVSIRRHLVGACSIDLPCFFGFGFGFGVPGFGFEVACEYISSMPCLRPAWKRSESEAAISYSAFLRRILAYLALERL